MAADSPKILKLPDDRDVAIQKVWLREQFERYYPKIPLIRLDRSATLVDDLYRESQTKRFQNPIEILAYVDPEPEKRTLTKYGIEDQRDLLIYFSTLHLEEAKILEDNTTFLIGDLIRYDSDYFEVVDQRRAKEGYWANTNIPFFMMCACKRYRMGG